MPSITIYNYTGAPVSLAVSQSYTPMSGVKLGSISPSADPKVFDLDEEYDTYNFAGTKYYGQTGNDYLASQFGGDGGFDPSDVIIAVGVAPDKMIGPDLKAIVPPTGINTVYLLSYKASTVNKVLGIIPSMSYIHLLLLLIVPT